MNSYRTTPRAAQDLIEHFAFIARDKIAPANRFLKVAEQSFQRLAAMPGMGSLFESANRTLQHIHLYPMPSPQRNYLIFYRVVNDDAIDILAILRGARDLEKALAEIL